MRIETDMPRDLIGWHHKKLQAWLLRSETGYAAGPEGRQ